jgi:hypothetical protein
LQPCCGRWAQGLMGIGLEGAEAGRDRGRQLERQLPAGGRTLLQVPAAAPVQAPLRAPVHVCMVQVTRFKRAALRQRPWWHHALARAVRSLPAIALGAAVGFKVAQRHTAGTAAPAPAMAGDGGQQGQQPKGSGRRWPFLQGRRARRQGGTAVTGDACEEVAAVAARPMAPVAAAAGL